MKFINCCKLVRGLSCAARRQQIFLNSSMGPCASFVTQSYQGNGHHRTPQSISRNQQGTPQSISRNQQGLMLLQIRQRTSYPMVGHQSSLPSSKTADSGVSDEPQSLREKLKQMRDLGKSVPEVITDADLEYYASLTSKNGQKKFLSFLFKKEIIRRKERQEKLQKKLARKKLECEDEDRMVPPNKLFRRLSGASMLTGYNWKLASAMQFGPQIAFDFSFDEHMKRPDIINMISQLTHVLNANKESEAPFYMHWTGLKANSITMVEMQRMVTEFQNLMVNVTETDVIDMFPREKLIYLSGDSKNIMHSFDVDKVYIIGGLVDSTIKTGVTLAKAKRYNISHARFPLDLYLKWGHGGKALTLDQVARILHTVHETGDWVKALQHVPKRKHSGLKVTQTLDPRISEKIGTRQDLEKYYLSKKKQVELGQSRRESHIRDSSRFAFSRAKREFKWDILPASEVPGRGTEEGGERTTSLDWEDDLTGDTLFKSPSDTNNYQRKKGSKWFEE